MQPQDDASSGYASDQPFSLDSIKEQQKKQEGETVRLSTHVDAVQQSRIISSTTLACSSSTSAETLKTMDVTERHIDKFDADGTLKADIASWNTNNSGQIKSNYTEDSPKNQKTSNSEIANNTKACILCRKIETYPNQFAIRRAPSFPDDIDKYNVYQANSITSTCSKNHHSRTLLLRQHKHNFKLKRSISSDQLSDILKLSVEKNKLLTDFVKSFSKSVLKNPRPLDNVASNPLRHTPEVTAEKRARGNTQTSLDSGVITDANVTSSPLHDTSCVTVSKQALLSSVKNPSANVKDENQWRVSGPKGKTKFHVLNLY